MRTMSYADAIEDALAQAMPRDPRIMILGEDVRALGANLLYALARSGSDRHHQRRCVCGRGGGGGYGRSAPRGRGYAGGLYWRGDGRTC